MKEHVTVTVTYEADDGKLFEAELDCMSYELNTLYEKSGIRFAWKNGRVMKKLDPLTAYDKAEFVTIDRSKEVENKAFIDTAVYYYGWCLVEELLYDEKATKYRFLMDKLEPILK